MNACLRELASSIVNALHAALAELGIEAPVYLSQNDGTLMTVAYAERYPVSTFASGPTNSMRGAAFLSGLEDCAVVDIGGTTSDVGILQHGFPREAGVAVETSTTADSPSEAIVRCAESIQADLIVMGTRGFSGLKHVLLGSVAERTLRLAPCPVLAVKER